MDKVVPWSELCAVIEPFYPKARPAGGRRPVGLERMLRIHFLQQWCGGKVSGTIRNDQQDDHRSIQIVPDTIFDTIFELNPWTSTPCG
jgi:hypothetical protein